MQSQLPSTSVCLARVQPAWWFDALTHCYPVSGVSCLLLRPAAVLTAQVFEALRSQSDYETFLGSLSAPAGPQAGAGRVKLPHQWLQGIAAQLKQNTTVGRCVCVSTQGLGVCVRVAVVQLFQASCCCLLALPLLTNQHAFACMLCLPAGSLLLCQHHPTAWQHPQLALWCSPRQQHQHRSHSCSALACH